MVELCDFLYVAEDFCALLCGKYRGRGGKDQPAAGNGADEPVLAGIIQGKIQKGRVKHNGMMQRFPDGLNFMQLSGINKAGFSVMVLPCMVR